MKSKKIILFVFCLFISNNTCLAKVLPITGIDIVIKNTNTKKILTTVIDENGRFVFAGLDKGDYELYLSDESHQPMLVTTTTGQISGQANVNIDEPKIEKTVKKLEKKTSKKNKVVKKKTE